MKKPIVWTIAGSDSGGGAGIQADLLTLHDLQVHGCSVITALTAQNSIAVTDVQFTTPQNLSAQLQTLAKDLPAKTIKIGMVGKVSLLNIIHDFISQFKGDVILDPVMLSTSGNNLLSEDLPIYRDTLIKLFQHTRIITPNIPETEALLNIKITTLQDMETAATALLKLGARSVLIKGGHLNNAFANDYWSDGKNSFWLNSKRIAHLHNHGSGCTLASAIAGALALDFNLEDALVIAKMYVNQGLHGAKSYGKGPGPVAHLGWPQHASDLPYLTSHPLETEPKVFPDCGHFALGLYPIVDSVAWLKKLLPLGIKTFQLRIKNTTQVDLENELSAAISLAKYYHARLFINDHWELAIKHSAYGVHLGQEDLETADIHAIYQANLRLGISTHSYAEIAKAHAYKPSYIAYGPIYATTSKPMNFAPQGLESLAYWQRLLNYPLVAIGGINLSNLKFILDCGVENVALISAITHAKNPIQAAQQLLSMMEEYSACKKPGHSLKMNLNAMLDI